MKEIILHKLQEIERQHDVRVLLAVESGSRAWGFASPDSDYDIRFIYVSPTRRYLSLQKCRDVIEQVDDHGVIDLAGWDLKKALTLMSKGNCAMAEWLASPIIYYKDDIFYRDICEIKDQSFRTVTAVNHYYHLAMNHDLRYIEKRGSELKRFMYFIRGLLAAQWALDKHSYPPVPFMQLVDDCVSDEAIKTALSKLVILKSQSKEHDRCIVDTALTQYAIDLARDIAARLPGLQAEKRVDCHALDTLFLNVLERIYYDRPEDILQRT